MRLGIFGRKVGMTTIFDDAGLSVPITVIDTKGCFITQVKTKQTDGYNALQVGFGPRKPQNVTKAQQGHFKKAGVPATFTVQELRFEDADDMTQFKSGQELSPLLFQKGDMVDVTGCSKGKGFTGVIKRYGWHGGDATHGVSKYFRHGGSNGTNTFPGRVLKRKGMPGHVGDVKRTVIGMKVIEVKEKENLILLRGAVPGSKTGPILISSTNRKVAPTGRAWVQA